MNRPLASLLNRITGKFRACVGQKMQQQEISGTDPSIQPPPVANPAAAEGEAPSPPGELPCGDRLSGEVLVVEDSMIIAMEAEYLLLSLGASHCHVAASVGNAVSFLEHAQPTFALLDVNLGSETSEPIAAELRARGVPFVVASGYGDKDTALDALGSAPLLAKPYTRNQLSAAVERALKRAD